MKKPQFNKNVNKTARVKSRTHSLHGRIRASKGMNVISDEVLLSLVDTRNLIGHKEKEAMNKATVTGLIADFIRSKLI